MSLPPQVGNVTGSKDWQTSGKQEHAEGEGETKAAEAKGWAEGAKDQVAGYKDKVVGAVTNDKSQEVSGTCISLSPTRSNTHVVDIHPGNVQHESGKAQKEANS